MNDTASILKHHDDETGQNNENKITHIQFTY